METKEATNKRQSYLLKTAERKEGELVDLIL